MELREGYKQTEVGVIPEDWSIHRLRNYVEEGRLPSGIYKDKNLYGEGNKIIKLGDVFGHDLFSPSLAQRVRLSREEVTKYRVKIGDIFIALASVKLEGVGKVMLVDNLDEDTVFDHNVALIRLSGSVDQNFICDLFKSYIIRNLVASRATQVGTTFLKASTILGFPLPLPPTKTEQTAIANALSDADAWIQSLTRLIAKKRQIKQGAMQTLFNPYENGRLKTGWVEKTLGDVAEVIGGGTPSSFRSSFWNGDIDWYTPTEIGENKYVYESRRKITKEGYSNSSANFLPIGTILLTSRAGIGDLGILMKEGCTNQGFQSLISKESTGYEFLYYLMGTLEKELLQNASGSTFLEISPGKLKQIEVVIPQKSEQIEIATILSNMDAEITALESKLTKAQQIKQGMMQNLLTGRIRLVGAGASVPDISDGHSARLKPHLREAN